MPNPLSAAAPVRQHHDDRRAWRRARGMLAGLAATSVVVGGLNAGAAQAATVTSAAFSGGPGTVSVGGTLYARNGAALTLNVATGDNTVCVDVSGAFTGHQTSATARPQWTFASLAGAGDGSRGVTVAAASRFNTNGVCNGPAASASAAYVVDNTGPTVAAGVTPAPNSAGWNNEDVTVRWTATDAGSGVAAAQPFRTDSVTANGIVTLSAPAQADRLSNTGAAGAVTVRVDKAKPSITATQTKHADGTTTVTFTCNDSNSGGGDPSGIATCLADGSTTNSKTVQPGATVTGTATDKAGNTTTASSTAPAGDTTAPTLSGAPTTQPNGNGWYQGDVTVDWTAGDPESGIPAAPADTTITGEGTGLTSTQTVKNGAGLSTTATSSPAVKIDRTPPTTGISGTSNAWVNDDVTVTLSSSDNLSGVASTSYSVDGGVEQAGTSFTLSTEGEHTVTFSSTDKAGNVEAAQTARVTIDKTAPTIGHSFTPSSYTDDAWTNQDVKVTFECADQGGSGVAGCTAPVTKSAEGEHTVTGTATDGAGNSATDSASVRIDKTVPTITATASGTKNAAGWYKDDVTVSYTANDGASGISGTPASKVLAEGANQGASATVTDAAGNSASAGVTGINVDKTDPVLTGSFPAGWNVDDVTVAWTCTDTLSGPAGQPADTVVGGEGDNLSATASCTDVAGNTVTTTVTGIQIDRTAPVTTAALSGAPKNGFYNAAVQVTLSAHDNLTDVAETSYTLDGGAPQKYTGAFSVGTDGEHTVTFWSKDSAGNVESAGAPVTFLIDTTAPATKVINPISPDSGWFVTSGIPVAFEATDGGSGVAATYYTIDGGPRQTYGEPFTADLSTGTHTISYWSVDLAGNEEAHETTNTVEVKVDTIAPEIEGSQTPAANSAGWNNTDVDVTFTCTDAASGINGVAGCAGDTTLSNDGAGQQVVGDAVDVAGNRSSTTYGPVNIDTTKPTLKGVPADPNGAGWYKDDVKVTWVGDDALSGLDPATQPAVSTVIGEGSNLGAGPVTIKDKAGNVSEPAAVSGLKIDRTAPAITGTPTSRTAPVGGWYRDEVVVDFTCSDSLSGVSSCPTSKVIKGDGANQSVTSDPALDVAGNASAGRTVGGINVDGSAPTTTANNTCTAVNDYCKGETANVVLTAADQAGLSGLKEIRYTVNGGTEQSAAGSTTTVGVTLSGTGAATVKYWAVDNAGNVETANSVSLKWDNIAPTVTHTLTPKPNADEWNSSDVTVSFSAKDDDSGSGIASVTPPVIVSTETAGRLVAGTAKDTAGNVGTDSVTVKLDKTQPTITGAVTSGTRTASGWYGGPVTVTFTCWDALSGVATCPDPVVLTANGANTTTGKATDKAGNEASATVSGIQIDQEKPTLTTADISVQGQTYVVGAVPTATCTATDSFSGLASCKVTVTSPANSVGTIAYSATAIDNAGNSTTVAGTYTIKYRFDGFLQPINDTAHQVGTSTSVFKAGSTVPVKFRIMKSDGTLVQLAVAPAWLTPVKGSAMSAPVDESVYSVSADSGTTYRYDATAQQYIYNWKTGTGGNYWRIGVKFDDGQTYHASIGLR